MMDVGHLSAARSLMSSFNLAEIGEGSDVEHLRTLIGQQNLIIQTLLALLLEKGVIREDEFNDWAQKMDQLDGTRDGKLAEDPSTVVCTTCGCVNPHDATECADCGKELVPRLVYPG